MGAAGGITYAVLNPNADYARFSFLMRFVPLNTDDPGNYGYGEYDYSSFELDPPQGIVFEAYWRDTYEAFSFQEDLQNILTDILENEGFSIFYGSSSTLITSETTWLDILEDWNTSPLQKKWPYAWRLMLDHLVFLYEHYRSLYPWDMTLKEWAAEVNSMVSYMDYEETWT